MIQKTFPLRYLWTKLPRPLRNKYILTVFVFVLWLLLFDRNGFLTQVDLQRSINRLEQDQEFYKEAIIQAENDKMDLEINKEKFAREKYFMKKKNEDVFIIQD